MKIPQHTISKLVEIMKVHIHKQMHKSSIQAYRLQFLLEGLP